MDENNESCNDGSESVSAHGNKTRKKYPRISYRAYEHPVALTALTTMRKIRGFDAALKAVNAAVSEPVIRMQYLSSAIKVGPRQFRHLHDMVEESIGILDLNDPPEVYVRDIGVNAATIGMKRPFIVISSGLMQVMDEEELRFVIGHELGHVLSGHSVYHTMGQLLAGTVSLSSVPLVALASEGIQVGIREWFRKSELSCDRAGLLVTQNPSAAIGALMKLATGARIPGMSTDGFLQQAAEFELDTTGVKNRIYKFMLPSETHPILVLRAAELDRWIRTGGYDRITRDGVYESRDDDSSATVKGQVKSGYEGFMENRRQKKEDRESRRSEQAAE